MDIARGYEPVDKLDTKIMASRQALSEMDFSTLEIDKIEAVNKERKRFLKRSKELAKLSKKGKLGFENVVSASHECPVCDICYNPTGVIKLNSPDDETKIPPDWSSFALVRLSSPNHSDYRAYILLPSGIVIDYQSRKVYVVCGNCRVLLGLRSTESGILIHNQTEGTGYGFVDLDRVDKLMQMYKAHKSMGKSIKFMMDFNEAVQIWKEQSPKIHNNTP